MNKLQEYRLERGLTQEELAKLANMNIKTLQSYEQGHRSLWNASCGTVLRLARVLKCKVTDLLEESN